MNILHISPYFPPDHWGGIELHVFELSKYLSKHHQVTVIASLPKNKSTVEAIGRVRVVKLRGFEIRGVSPLFTRIENPLIPNLSSMMRKLNSFDLVHAHGQEYAISYFAIREAVRSGTPCVLTIHHTGEALSRYPAIRLLRRILKKTAFKFSIEAADATIAVSKGAVRYLSSFRPRRTYLIPNGIDLERFSGVETSSEYVLFVGRLDPLKGPEYIVRAIPLILKKVDTRFLLVGAGPQRDMLEELAHHLQVDQYVSFQSNVSYQELPRIISKAAVLVAPYNAGYSMLEAGAASKPVVSADMDWNREALHDAAIYVEPKNVRQLSEAVIRVLTDRSLAQEIGRRARDFIAKNRAWEIVGRKVEAVYESILR